MEALLAALLVAIVKSAPDIIDAIKGAKSTEEALAIAHAGVLRLVAKDDLAQRIHSAAEKRRREIEGGA
ncbi:MAG: hypothetical protein M3Q55_15295 [Acidobacteriota bacterium]|nr:hypothetical protein [Acidobacteriota bacterium]